MRARSSVTVFGDRFRRRRRWCRESRLGLIFCARGAREAAAEINRASSRNNSLLFDEFSVLTLRFSPYTPLTTPKTNYPHSPPPQPTPRPAPRAKFSPTHLT